MKRRKKKKLTLPVEVLVERKELNELLRSKKSGPMQDKRRKEKYKHDLT